MWEEKQITEFYDQIGDYKRELFCINGGVTGPTIIFIGGIHGNEPLGIRALQEVGKELKKCDAELFRGRTVAYMGNIAALRKKKRFVNVDLNRVWSREHLDELHYNKLSLDVSEFQEMRELYDLIKVDIESATGPVYIIDLHTTSAPTTPFIVTNNREDNLAFVSHFPLPNVSGLTGFLDGTLLSYMTDLGHVGLAYEAGQHLNVKAMYRHEAFIWLSLFYSGFLDPEYHEEEMSYHMSVLEEPRFALQKSFKIISRYKIGPDEDFEMMEGYKSFDPVKKGEVLATNDDGEIRSPYDGLIFMPKYQAAGDDGFFVIREVE